MAIYNLIYYSDNVPKKFLKKKSGDITIWEQSFNLNELTSDVHKRLFELIPHFKDLSNINLTVDFKNLSTRTYQNYLYINLSYINDIYYLFGLPVDMESIVSSSGKVFIDDKLPITSNRVVIEEPKLEICINNETSDFYTFSVKDSPNKIIQKAFEYYIELVRKLREKFVMLEERKELLRQEVEELQMKENDRLKQLELFQKKANEMYIKDKYNWITNYGSKHLKFLYNLNYEQDCNVSYVNERVKYELGDWVVDFNKEVIYNKRSIPSEDAIEITEQAQDNDYTTEVVWIKKGIKGIRDECEAVVIHDYLNQHRIFYVINIVDALLEAK
ncbi:hypothetical protein EDC18_10447 [Natranaerovirga pectinivora]|uniref:Uncharacterized protein n=1 Tax=Natranaerovirga pectinivora TaxID=682400 RepID=A0A4R3MKJ4_9FIRM|nr:hypothetical protein [Natranaerovirga pectinivora]TCT14899.1 hypothetical protein EDC18_10447 [Natranaerovirga pectinivora]